MRIIPLSIAALAISVLPVSAFDLGHFSDRFLACDGPGMTLMEDYVPNAATARDEMQGMAVLELVEIIVDDQSGSLRSAAKNALGIVKQAALTKASKLIEDCNLAPADSADQSMRNPFRR